MILRILCILFLLALAGSTTAQTVLTLTSEPTGAVCAQFSGKRTDSMLLVQTGPTTYYVVDGDVRYAGATLKVCRKGVRICRPASRSERIRCTVIR
jgi:glycerol kinase